VGARAVFEVWVIPGRGLPQRRTTTIVREIWAAQHRPGRASDGGRPVGSAAWLALAMSVDYDRVRARYVARVDPNQPGDPRMYAEWSVGWTAILDDLADELDRVAPGMLLGQVKEKFGELRVYVAAEEPPAGAGAAIEAAEDRSRHTCQVCGRPSRGPGSRYGWVRTLCRRHAFTYGHLRPRWRTVKHRWWYWRWRRRLAFLEGGCNLVAVRRVPGTFSQVTALGSGARGRIRTYGLLLRSYLGSSAVLACGNPLPCGPSHERKRSSYTATDRGRPSVRSACNSSVP
jgi:hypothetical protein